jgi:hypothetical protein
MYPHRTSLDGMEDNGMTKRVTIQEAARLLETTEGAIRKRVQRGSLDSERSEDGRVYVRVDAGETRRDERHDAGQTDQDTALAAKDELVAILREQLAAERAAHGETRRILAGLVQRLPEIEAAEPREPSEDAPGTPPGGDGGVYSTKATTQRLRAQNRRCLTGETTAPGGAGCSAENRANLGT